MAITRKNSSFILSEGSDFQIVINLSIAVHALPMPMLTLFSVDEILLPRYLKWSINFRGFLFTNKIINFVVFVKVI